MKFNHKQLAMEIAMKTMAAVALGYFAIRVFHDFMATKNVVPLLLLVSESITLFLVIFSRFTDTYSRYCHYYGHLLLLCYCPDRRCVINSGKAIGNYPDSRYLLADLCQNLFGTQLRVTACLPHGSRYRPLSSGSSPPVFWLLYRTHGFPAQ